MQTTWLKLVHFTGLPVILFFFAMASCIWEKAGYTPADPGPYVSILGSSALYGGTLVVL